MIRQSKLSVLILIISISSYADRPLDKSNTESMSFTINNHLTSYRGIIHMPGDLVENCFKIVRSQLIENIDTYNPNNLDLNRVTQLLYSPDFEVKIHEDSPKYSVIPLAPLNWRGTQVDMLNYFPKKKLVVLSRSRWDYYCKQERIDELVDIFYHELEPQYFVPDPLYAKTSAYGPGSFGKIKLQKLQAGQYLVFKRYTCSIGEFYGSTSNPGTAYVFSQPSAKCINIQKEELSRECKSKYQSDLLEFYQKAENIITMPNCVGECISQVMAFWGICQK